MKLKSALRKFIAYCLKVWRPFLRIPYQYWQLNTNHLSQNTNDTTVIGIEKLKKTLIHGRGRDAMKFLLIEAIRSAGSLTKRSRIQKILSQITRERLLELEFLRSCLMMKQWVVIKINGVDQKQHRSCYCLMGNLHSGIHIYKEYLVGSVYVLKKWALSKRIIIWRIYFLQRLTNLPIWTLSVGAWSMSPQNSSVRYLCAAIIMYFYQKSQIGCERSHNK